MTFQDEKAIAVDRRRGVENRFGLRDIRDVVALIDKLLKRRGEFLQRDLLAKLGREPLLVEFSKVFFLHGLVEGDKSVKHQSLEFLILGQLGSFAVQDKSK